MLLSLSTRCVRTSSGRRKQHLSAYAVHIGLHACITFRNKIVTKSNKLSQIVTLRHNNYIFLRFRLRKVALSVAPLGISRSGYWKHNINQLLLSNLFMERLPECVNTL